MAPNQTRDPASDQLDRADTATRILDVAERLVQLRGLNGFSYADVAAELHITKASLHYHFPGKAELGCALIERYAERFSAALEAIDQQETDPVAKIHAYAAIYGDVLSKRRMCLCGMLAAGYDRSTNRCNKPSSLSLMQMRSGSPGFSKRARSPAGSG